MILETYILPNVELVYFRNVYTQNEWLESTELFDRVAKSMKPPSYSIVWGRWQEGVCLSFAAAVSRV